MAVALLMMVVAGLFVAATASVMSNRALQTSYLEVAMKRRMAMENSKEFHHQFMLERALYQSSTEPAARAGEFADGWGGVDTADGWSNLQPFATSAHPSTLATVFPYNYTGLRPAESFLVTERTVRPSTLDGSVDAFTAWSFIKTQSPGLGGDALVVYKKPAVAAGQIEIATPESRLRMRVEGRMVVRDPESFFAESTPNPLELYVYADSLYIQKHSPTRRLYCKNTDGDDIAPSNLPAARSTTGPIPDGTTTDYLYNGTLNVINNPSNPDNSLYHFMEREQLAGNGNYETISSGDPAGVSTDPWYLEHQTDPTYKPPAWPSGYPPIWKVLFINVNHPNLNHMRILGVVDQIVLVGQTTAADYNAAGLLAPRIITVVPNGATGPNFQDLRCLNENNRRLVMAVQDWNATKLDVYWEGTSVTSTLYRWRMAFINEYRTVWANLPSAVTKSVHLTGGVMTNWSFKRRGAGSTTRLTLKPDYNPDPAGAVGSPYRTLLPRDGWMETYFLPTPP